MICKGVRTGDQGACQRSHHDGGSDRTITNQKQIVELAAKKRLPAIYTSSTYVNAGGLMSYAPNELENYRRAAIYVDKILKGAKPGIYP